MKMMLHGVRALDFSDDNGKSIKGQQLFVSYQDPDVVGTMTNKIFIREDFKGLGIDPVEFIDSEIEVEFGMKGKILSVTAA